MKTLFSIQKVIFFGMALILCAGQVGAVQAAPQGTIQGMITNAPEFSTVTIPIGTFAETLVVDKTLTLQGDSAATSILQPAGANQRVIRVTAGHNLTLVNLRVTGGQAYDDTGFDVSGGGVYLEGGSLTLAHCVINLNSATYGGGVYQAGNTGSVTVSDSDINNNIASADGGGLFVAGSATLSHTALSYNTAGGHGGGMSVNGSATLTESDVLYNHATGGNGGGVNVNNGLTLNGASFISNTAGDSGGGLTQWNENQTVSMVGSSFAYNTAKNNGGGAYIRLSFATLDTVSFIRNKVELATNYMVNGGGLFAGGGLDGSHLTISANQALCSGCNLAIGGGLYITRAAPARSSSITQSTFNANLAQGGSAIYSGPNVQLTVTSTSFFNNGDPVNASFGGAVSADWLHGDKVLFQNNSASNKGGGLNVTSAVLTDTRFIGNSTGASGTGGGVMAYHDFNGTNLLFAGNDSPQGAALYVQAGPAVLWHATIGRLDRGTGAAIYVLAGSTLELKNSIISSYAIGIVVDGTVNDDYNLYFNNGTNFPILNNGVHHLGAHTTSNYNPLFVNPAAVDYHLTLGSFAISLGANLGVSTDLDGRPRLGRFDAGAYQFYAHYGNVYVPMIRK